ncbi:MAG: sensor histidine kinase [Bacteroidales bacterium]|nr:sensor histidine kinase [Bacteroidales bacterium]
MNVALLIKKYFSSPMSDVTIDVFDKKNINNVFRQIISVLTQHISIETTLLQAMSYCFYEILDNVLIHSGKENGTVITHYSQQEHMLSFLIADDGKGIKSSLSENSKYASIEESEALKICVEDSVTDGKGMGFGLYSASRLAHNVGLRFDVRSGNHTA